MLQMHCARQLAESVATLHRAGHAHLSLSPCNVLLGHDGRWKVADFGFSALHGVHLCVAMATPTEASHMLYAAPGVLELRCCARISQRSWCKQTRTRVLTIV